MDVSFSNLEVIENFNSNPEFPGDLFLSPPSASPTSIMDNASSMFGWDLALDSADLLQNSSSAQWDEVDTTGLESPPFFVQDQPLDTNIKHDPEQEEWMRQFDQKLLEGSINIAQTADQFKQVTQDNTHFEEDDDQEEPDYETEDDDEEEREMLRAAAKEKPSRDEFGFFVARVYRPYVQKINEGVLTHIDVAKILSAAFPMWRRKFTRDFMTKVYRGRILQKYVGPISAPARRAKASVTGNEFDRINGDSKKLDKIKNEWFGSYPRLSAAALASKCGISRPVAHRLITQFKKEEEEMEQQQ